MTPDLEALVVAAYVFADEYRVPARRGPAARISDAELVALAVCQAAMGISSDRQFLGLVGYRLPGWFPHIPSQSQYNRRLRGLTGLLTAVQQRLARLLDVGGARLADGTLIGVANYAGCAQRSEFAGNAAYGYCAAKSEYVWGVRLVLRTDRRGLPLAYTLVPAAILTKRASEVIPMITCATARVTTSASVRIRLAFFAGSGRRSSAVQNTAISNRSRSASIVAPLGRRRVQEPPTSTCLPLVPTSA